MILKFASNFFGTRLSSRCSLEIFATGIVPPSLRCFETLADQLGILSLVIVLMCNSNRAIFTLFAWDLLRSIYSSYIFVHIYSSRSSSYRNIINRLLAHKIFADQLGVLSLVIVLTCYWNRGPSSHCLLEIFADQLGVRSLIIVMYNWNWGPSSRCVLEIFADQLGFSVSSSSSRTTPTGPSSHCLLEIFADQLGVLSLFIIVTSEQVLGT